MMEQSNLDKALAHHQSGQFNQADFLYQAVTESAVENAEAWHLWGVLAYQTQDFESAKLRLEKALSLSPKSPHYHSNYGNLLKDIGELDLALEHYRKALSLNPKMAETHNNLGTLFQAQKKYKLAIKHYEKALKILPGLLDAQLNLAQTYHTQKLYFKAEQTYRKVLKQNPEHGPTYFQLGLVYQDQEKYPEALDSYQKAHTLSPKDPVCLNNAGYVLQQLGEETEAFTLYNQALKLDPSYLSPLFNLGVLFESKSDPEQAFIAYKRIIEQAPEHFMAHYNVGCLHLKNNQDALAKPYFETCLKLHPENPDVLISLGNIADNQGDFKGAQCFYEKILSFAPKHIGAVYNLGILARDSGDLEKAQADFQRLPKQWIPGQFAQGTLDLLQGRFEQGWPLYEKRADIPTLKLPLWKGESLSGKHLLIMAEQGFGDIIQMSRYIESIDAAKISFYCPDALRPLFQDVFPNVDCIEGLDDLSDFEVYIPIMSLPKLMKTNIETVPDCPQWSIKSKLLPHADVNKPLKVGLVWAAGYKPDPVAYRMYQKKSLKVTDFSGVLALENTQFYSLQVGRDALKTEIPQLNDLQSEINSFHDTAALIQSLDLIISVDTAVAHLAGSMGKPVWLLLPFMPDWRWLLACEDSPWYPSFRLFRQSVQGDWGAVIDSIKEALPQFEKK